MEEVIQMISNVGFPIAICLVLLWYIMKLTETHKEETKEFTKALENNTIVLERLCNKFDVERDDLDD